MHESLGRISTLKRILTDCFLRSPGLSRDDLGMIWGRYVISLDIWPGGTRFVHSAWFENSPGWYNHYSEAPA